MHDAITDSTKHCRMAGPVADNALLLEPNCIYVCMFIFITYADVDGQSWDKFVINCFGVWYNLYLPIRGLYHPRLRLGWYSSLIARYKLYHTPKQLITNIISTGISISPCQYLPSLSIFPMETNCVRQTAVGDSFPFLNPPVPGRF